MFAHAQTGNALKDHTEHVIWLGPSEPLEAVGAADELDGALPACPRRCASVRPRTNSKPRKPDMNRILEIPPEKLSPEQTTVFNQLVAGRGRILGPYKIWIHSPTVASGMEHIGTFLNKRSSLSKREVEIGILVIAQHWDADYVRQAHIREGKAAGLTQETIDAILAGGDPEVRRCARARRLRVCPRAGVTIEAVGRRIRRDRRRSWAGRASPRC